MANNNKASQRYILLCILFTWIIQIFCSIHFFLPFWLDVDVSKQSVDYDRTEGLYLRCDTPSKGQNETDKIKCDWAKSDDSNSDILWCSRILWLGGSLLMMIVTFSTCCLLGNTFKSKKCAVALAVTSFLVSVILIATVTVYGVNMTDDDRRLAWGYYLAVVTSILPMITGLIFIIKRSDFQKIRDPSKPPRVKETAC